MVVRGTLRVEGALADILNDPADPDHRQKLEDILAREVELGYLVPSGRYWEAAEQFDPAELDRLDRLWLQAATMPLRQTG